MGSNEAEYNNIASEYVENIDDLGLIPVESYTVDNCILGPLLNEQGLLTGKRVLDLACGAGRYTRRLRALDCAYILGVDISSEMIEVARNIEKEDPKGIEYMVSDVKKLPPPEVPFDLVTAFYLLHYARTREELLQMARSIYAQLGENNHFIGLANNIQGTTASFEKLKYGLSCHVKVPLVDGIVPEGTEVFLTLSASKTKPAFTFSTFYLSHKTHEEVFKEAGFKKFEWIPYQCDPNAPNKEFYDDFLKDCSDIGFKATK